MERAFWFQFTGAQQVPGAGAAIAMVTGLRVSRARMSAMPMKGTRSYCTSRAWLGSSLSLNYPGPVSYGELDPRGS